MSSIDDAHMRTHRRFRDECRDDPRIRGRVLEIGPDPEHRQGREDWETLDILPGCTHQFDLSSIHLPRELRGRFDTILCMEVLEHCIEPFGAINNCRWMLRAGGTIIGSTPLNARIHGPLPDCWRFTVHGLRVLLKDWDNVSIIPRESDRFLFPIGYRWSATCQHGEAFRDASKFIWEWIE